MVSASRVNVRGREKRLHVTHIITTWAENPRFTLAQGVSEGGENGVV
jgi:hypothetical protein